MYITWTKAEVGLHAELCLVILYSCWGNCANEKTQGKGKSFAAI